MPASSSSISSSAASGASALDFVGEILAKIDVVLGAKIVEGQAVVAHQGLDNGRAQQIVVIDFNTLPDRQLAVLDQSLVLHGRDRVLGKQIADVADGADAERNQIAMAVCRIALEVALQRTVAAGPHQFVARQREMVHADIHVTRRAQLFDRVPQQLQLGFRHRYVVGVDHALALEALRQVRVVVNREPVGLHGDHEIECRIETLDRLDAAIRK